MEWYRQVQFVSAVAMPPDAVDAYGTTVNGMWADPETLGADDVRSAHDRGRRVLFSVPTIALEPKVYEGSPSLLDDVCRDVDGGLAECDWYFWESKPVYAACIYAESFRGYLFDRCLDGVRRGADVVNLDEIMTNIGLMNRDPRGSGFCARCLDRFRDHLRLARDPDSAALGDDELRAAIRDDDAFYVRYRAFHERAAFRVMTAFIRELRTAAAGTNPAFAISANVAYLGSLVLTFGALWGCLWGPHVDFVMMENHYRVEHGAPHLVLPRGTFAAWYRLGSSLTGSPTWICPSITVPRQLGDRRRTTYYLLMFLEAYVNGGRWGYHWWPGVDARTRLAATVPEELKAYIPFIAGHRGLYEDAVAGNDLAVVYADGPISARPQTHVKYLALAQALLERGYQFDVVYAGDGRFNPEELDPRTLERYRALLLPEARDLGRRPTEAIEAFARTGGDVAVYSESPLDPGLVRHVDGTSLEDFWRRYLDEDRERILESVPDSPLGRIEASQAGVGVVRSVVGDRQVIHLLDYRYDEGSDEVRPIRDLRLRLPWNAGSVACSLLDLDGERMVRSSVEDGTLVVDVPTVDPYAVLVVAPEAAS